MFGKKYYNGVIRKYVIYFGTLFNNIEIDRVNSAGERVQTLRVPISYGPRQKFIERLNVDPNLDRQVQIQLPRMSFEMNSFQYDPERRMNPMRDLYKGASTSFNLSSVGTPTPFNIGFELAILVKNAEDGVRILEQILPYFTPEYTATLKLLDNLDFGFDIPVVFSQMQTQDTYEGNFEQRRAIIHTLQFEVKGYVFGPVEDKKGIIKTANTQFYVDPGAAGVFTINSNATPASKVHIKPGLDANGNPTTNNQVTINTNSISANDNFDYIINKTFNG